MDSKKTSYLINLLLQKTAIKNEKKKKETNTFNIEATKSFVNMYSCDINNRNRFASPKKQKS